MTRMWETDAEGRCTKPGCGEVHNPDRCQAHKKNEPRLGKQCDKRPMRGQRVCESHGGAAGKTRGEAAVELAKAKRVANTYGLPVDIGPHEALLEEIARTNGHVQFLVGVIRSLSPNTLVFGVSGTTAEQKKGVDAGKVTAWESLSVSESAAVNVWLALYHQERKHLVDVCKAAIGCGIEERRVRVAEQTGVLLAEIVRAIIRDPELGIPAERQDAAFTVAARHLRSLAAA